MSTDTPTAPLSPYETAQSISGAINYALSGLPGTLETAQAIEALACAYRELVNS